MPWKLLTNVQLGLMRSQLRFEPSFLTTVLGEAVTFPVKHIANLHVRLELAIVHRTNLGPKLTIVQASRSTPLLMVCSMVP